jgi:hypothetical protein
MLCIVPRFRRERHLGRRLSILDWGCALGDGSMS